MRRGKRGESDERVKACDCQRACENGQSDGTRLCRRPHAFVSIYELATETQFWCFENNIFA